MELNYQINSKVRNKDNYDLIYSIIGKKNLNGIMHYQLQSNTSEIYLSEFALNERFIQVDPNDEYNNVKPVVSRIYSKIVRSLTKE